MSPSSTLVPVIGLGAFVAVVAVAGGGYWWSQQNGYTLHALVAEARSAEADGTRFAADKDEQACVDEAVTRAKGTGMTAALKAQPFLTTCLRAARPAAGFCDGVPAPYDVLTLGAWNRQRSSDYGLSPFEAPFVLQPIQAFCARPAKATVASGPDCSALKSSNGEWQATRDTTFVINTANGSATMRLPAGSVLHRNAFHMNGVDPVDVVDQRCRI
jgi:hypothetical protein